MFTLKIETGNAAFSEDRIAEITRMLRIAILKLEQGNTSGTLADSNGNLAGNFKITKN